MDILHLQGNILYLMFYTFASTLSIVFGGYLLWRRNNSIAPAITPPLRLRRWAAAFLVSLTLSHIWYLPLLYIRSADTRLMWFYLAGTLDFLVVYPLAIGVLLAMLQDRRRPGSVRQYGRWLRDNYADLEHKEVWQSFVAMAIMLLAMSIYAWETKAPSVKYVTQLFNIIISLFLLWRVETLSDLGTDHEKDLATAATAADVPDTERPSAAADAAADVEANSLSPLLSDNIAKLLRYHCEEKLPSPASRRNSAGPCWSTVPSPPSSWPRRAASEATAPSARPSSSAWARPCRAGCGARRRAPNNAFDFQNMQKLWQNQQKMTFRRVEATIFWKIFLNFAAV